MFMERLLAMWRRNTESNHDDLERIFSNGTLAQWLAEHRRKGLQDPRAQTREQLLKAGVPTVCVKSGVGHVIIPDSDTKNNK